MDREGSSETDGQIFLCLFIFSFFFFLFFPPDGKVPLPCSFTSGGGSGVGMLLPPCHCPGSALPAVPIPNSIPTDVLRFLPAELRQLLAPRFQPESQ